MPEQDGFPGERIIGFKYIKKQVKKKEKWQLVERMSDPEVVKIIGREAFQWPRIMTAPPQSLLPPLYRALTKHQLDGGIVNELPTTGDTYGITIAIKRRALKPNQ